MSEESGETRASEPELGLRKADKTAGPVKKKIGSLFFGCLFTIFLLWLLVTLICAVIGLITGYLYLPPARGHEIELHGAWARIVSAVILLFFALIFTLVIRNSRRKKRPKILGD